MTKISERITEALKLRDMTQAELAQKAGLSKAALTAYVKGQYLPKGQSIQKMAQVLNVSEDWLSGKDVPMNPRAPRITDKMLKFALFNPDEGVTDEMLREVKAYAEFILKKNS